MNPIQISEAKTASPLRLQKTSSFVKDFNYTLSPYSGCQFGCSYCYVPGVLHGLPTARGGWGSYVDVRSKSVEILQRQVSKLAGARIFMSATTDPYQPVESQQKITCELLKALADIPEWDFLLISTRSALVLRDLDIFTDPRMRDRVEIGISIPSDLPEIHAALEPNTQPFKGRFIVARNLRLAGVSTRIHAAPYAVASEDYVWKCHESAHWLWVDGTNRSAGLSDEQLRLLHDYEAAESWKLKFAFHLGNTRVGFGRDQFGWRWNREAGYIEPPPEKGPEQ